MEENPRRQLIYILKQELQQVMEERGPDFAFTIGHIIWNNLAHNRLQHLSVTSAEYVRRVESYYDEWYQYLNQLQQEDNQEEWGLLFDKLTRWAYSGLRRSPLQLDNQLMVDMSQEIAADIAARLKTEAFPYDVDFDAWIYSQVRFGYLQRIRGWKADLVYDSADDLDKWDERDVSLADPTAHQAFGQFEQREELLQAMAYLSEKQRQFLQLFYFDSMSFTEIAEEMQVSKNALYKLHFDALRGLRKGFK